MKPKLLDLIVCPYCHRKLKCKSFLTDKTDANEIIEGLLLCKCKRSYPIIRGVPRIFPDSFKDELIKKADPSFMRKYKIALNMEEYEHEAKKVVNEKLSVTDRFGFEWTHFSGMYNEYKKQFLGWIYPIKSSFFDKKLVLDAGCGQGRHVFYSTEFGAETIGIDLSESVDIAYANTKHQPNSHIIQADIYKLPFKEKTFDYIFSIGVIHHLPSPEEGFKNLTRYLKPKTPISVWVYRKEGNTFLRTMDFFRRHITCRMNLKLLKGITASIMFLAYPVLRYVYRPINRNKTTKRFAKLLPQNTFFYYLSNLNFEICRSIIFDFFLTPTANYYTKKEFSSWFKKSKVNNVIITSKNKNIWRGTGTKRED